MKRYDWEYNGEKMGLVERKNGICVLYSGVEELESELTEAEEACKELMELNSQLTLESDKLKELLVIYLTF